VASSDRGAAPGPSPEVRRALAPLLEHPGTTAIATDFDGTLSPIVEEPADARPLEGSADVLERLAHRFGVVAVVSGRPVSFLVEHLVPARHQGSPGPTDPPGAAAPRFVGLYGLESSGGHGVIASEPGAEQWRPVVAEAVDRLESLAPAGVEVEPKGLTVTVHWRRAPGETRRAIAAVEAEARRSGLTAHAARMSIELRPPLDVDKGIALRRLVAGCTAACYFGDDLGDLAAFAALAELASVDGLSTVSVAVVDEESAVEVAEAADVSVRGPAEALGALRWLARGGPAAGGDG
jgi:trehalose 6-phosphate phosphatase